MPRWNVDWFVSYAWTLVVDALVIMFFAAALWRSFGVWKPLGLLEAMAWSAAVQMVRGWRGK